MRNTEKPADFKVGEAEITEAQFEELNKALEAGDEKAVNELIAKRVAEYAERRLSERRRAIILRDVILNLHHCSHTKQEERGQSLLCGIAAILEGNPMGILVSKHLMTEIDKLNLERAKADCAGEA